MSLMFGSCDRCKTDPILIYAGKDLKATGAFKPGTFWVYQNDSTLQLDSVVVISYEYLPDTITEECKGKQVPLNYKEQYFTTTTSFFYNLNYLWTVKVGEPVLLANESGAADTIYTDAPCTDTSFCGVIDTLIVNNIKFTNVYERIDSSSVLNDGKLVYFYSAPSFGIIKKEIYDEDGAIESWSLLYSNIVQ